MVIDDRFQKLYDRLCGSRYSATIFITKEARKLCNQYQNVIQFSQALAWVLSGVVPQEIIHYKHLVHQRNLNATKYVDYILESVSDSSVRDSVYESLRRSTAAGHLIYWYKGVYDRDKQVRVRVLLRRIWYEHTDSSYHVSIV